MTGWSFFYPEVKLLVLVKELFVQLLQYRGRFPGDLLRRAVQPGAQREVMNVAAIGAGFSVTTMSILMAIDARWIVQRAREAGAHELLTDYLISSLRSCVFLAVVSAIALFFSPQP
jgi:hypothetical protein